MSNFYARFVPTKLGAQSDVTNVTKRKPENDFEHNSKRPRFETEKPAVVTQNFVKRFTPSNTLPSSKIVGTKAENALAKRSRQTADSGTITGKGEDILAKYSVTGAARKNDKDTSVRYRKPVTEKSGEIEGPEIEANVIKVKKQKKVPEGRDAQTDVQEPTEVEKHTGVREKFEKAKKQSAQRESLVQHETDPDSNTRLNVEAHGLEPLPQPAVIEEPHQIPTYSTLPPWLGQPTHIPLDTKSSFESLGISPVMVANLTARGLQQALPIQAAVIPILLERPNPYNSDIAVSAATGSGKTLSYILPIIEAIKDLSSTRLRGLIIVPTRELVKQVQETLNHCASGVNLRVATALGSKSIKEEADMLVEKYEAFDPKAYEEEKHTEIDWSMLSLTELFEKAKEERPVKYVTKYRSKVDVLVCTPGRLVEHLRATKGFSLDHLDWLVIDEVDRLLNESYQEWLEVVMPALESREATKERDEILRNMKINPPPRLIRKVILSATMTKDISKLNALKLRNPRLLVLEGDQKQNTSLTPVGEDVEHLHTVPSETGAFQIPDTLTEFAVLVGDGSDKPLYLLELLQTKIAHQKAGIQDRGGEDSSSSESSKESTSDSDSDDSDTSSSGSSSNTPQNSNSAITTTEKPKSPLPSTLIFTRSSEAAPRLARLLSLLSPSLAPHIVTLTRSTTTSATARKAFKSFRDGIASILITTDRAARGLDIPNIQHVISYDVPISTQFYVHRVGRTARAGKAGHAWTMLAHREARWFWSEIGKADVVAIRRGGKKVAKVTLDGVGKDAEVKRLYADALDQLGEEVRAR